MLERSWSRLLPDEEHPQVPLVPWFVVQPPLPTDDDSVVNSTQRPDIATPKEASPDEKLDHHLADS